MHYLNGVENILPPKVLTVSFERWWRSDNPQPYNSYGNYSAMRVSQIGFYYNSLDKVLEEAEKS